MITIRASALSDLLDCPARFEARHILNIKQPTSSAAQLGTAVHKGAEAFDRARLDGNPIKPTDAAGAVVDAIWKHEEDVDWSERPQKEAEGIALALHSKYCTEVAPKQTYTGVEVTCEALEITDLDLTLTGTTDRIKQTPEGYGIADLKTGGAAVSAAGVCNTAKHVIQMGVYELLAEHAAGVPITAPATIIGMNTGKTPAAQRVATGEIRNARNALLGNDDKPGVLQIASKIIHQGLFFGNARSQLCSEKYCPIFNKCQFRG